MSIMYKLMIFSIKINEICTVYVLFLAIITYLEACANVTYEKCI